MVSAITDRALTLSGWRYWQRFWHMDSESIHNFYDRYKLMLKKQYAVYIADTSLARNIHHYLRYRVYCEHKHYEKPSTAGVPQERDGHDLFATHFIIRNDTAKAWQGTARLIMSTRTQLPVQRMGALYPRVERALLQSSVAEVSRLAALRGACPWSPGSRHLLQATITGLLDYGRLRNIEHLVFLISPGLARILSRIGVPMEICGPPVEHKGQRRAFSASVAQAIRDIPWVRRNLTAGRFCERFSESAFAQEDMRYTERLAFGGITALAAGQASPLPAPGL